jgi:uncharacterized protein DUF4238
MARYRRQHYVPQSYLRRFAEDGRRLHVHDKVLRKCFVSNPRDVAQSEFFNDLFLRDDEGQIAEDVAEDLIERELGKWEAALTEMTAVARSVAEGGGANLDQRATMSICTAIQLVRIPEWRKHLVQLSTEELEADAARYIEERMPGFTEEFKINIALMPQQQAWLHAHFLWSTKGVVQIATDLFHYIWRIGVNRTGTPLYTSDRAVVATLYESDPLPLSRGAVRPDPAGYGGSDVVRGMLFGATAPQSVEVTFPLAPDLALLMYHPVYFAALQPKQGRPMLLSEHDVWRLNALQAVQCERQIYSISPDFTVAEKILYDPAYEHLVRRT